MVIETEIIIGLQYLDRLLLGGRTEQLCCRLQSALRQLTEFRGRQAEDPEKPSRPVPQPLNAEAITTRFGAQQLYGIVGRIVSLKHCSL